MKESSKKEFARSVWAVQVNKMGDGNLAKRANARKLDGNGGEEDRNCDGGLH